ncbi:MAG: lytic transglycosylase domain-containing protein, partial [candidate division NC10 bacterium]
PPPAPEALVSEPALLITEPPAEPEGSDPFPAEWQLSGAPSSASPTLPPYPVELNPHVQRFLDLFQSGGKRGVVERWLHKSGHYLGMIQEVFRQKGLPEDLAYTAMIESGFNPVAVSRAGAKGLWQFMAPTARRYGLKVDRWVDERLDPQKSTSAAADYLRDLFDQFGSWFLAQAAYNAGEVRVARAVQTSGTDNFWTIARGRLLKEETKRFVPAIQAATLIAREPVRYGFDVTPALPEPFDVVTVPFSLELAVIGKLAHIILRAPRLHTISGRRGS